MLLCRYTKDCARTITNKTKRNKAGFFCSFSTEKKWRKENTNENPVVRVFPVLFPVIYGWRTKLINRTLAWGMIFRYHNKVYEILTKYCFSCFGVTSQSHSVEGTQFLIRNVQHLMGLGPVTRETV